MCTNVVKISAMDELTKLLSDLVAIDSTNPDLVPGGAGESKLAQYIANWLRQAGLLVQLIKSTPGRPNVAAVARGHRGGTTEGRAARTLLLNGHMDTVGAANMPHPHEPVIRDGRLYGQRRV